MIGGARDQHVRLRAMAVLTGAEPCNVDLDDLVEDFVLADVLKTSSTKALGPGKRGYRVSVISGSGGAKSFISSGADIAPAVFLQFAKANNARGNICCPR